jgi:hypothetical protein
MIKQQKKTEVYHKFFPGEGLIRSFRMTTDNKGDRVRRFLGDGMLPTSERLGDCKCGGATAEVGGAATAYRVCLKCGAER